MFYNCFCLIFRITLKGINFNEKGISNFSFDIILQLETMPKMYKCNKTIYFL